MLTKASSSSAVSFGAGEEVPWSIPYKPWLGKWHVIRGLAKLKTCGDKFKT